MSRSNPRVSLIGAPTDVGAGHRGARLGPEALRIAGIGEALVKRGVDVIDRGNLDGPRNPWQKPVEGYRHLAEVVAWNRAVMDAVGTELADGRLLSCRNHVHGRRAANSVLVITFANERFEETKDSYLAALEAGYTRIRPVLMTAGAMIIGMFPMALGLGEGGEQNAPLGRAVIEGLIFATGATLFFVPTVFRLLRRHKPSAARMPEAAKS